MDNHIFRSAAFGFNRQDVLEYIERTQRESEARIFELSAQLNEARQKGSAAQQALEDCTQERDRLSNELADLKERYEAEADARGTIESESDRQKDRIRELEAANDSLTEQVRNLEGRMTDLRREKEGLIQLELDARCRSDELLAQAQARADDILAKANARGADIQAQAQVQADALLSETRKQIAASVEQCEDLLRSCETLIAHVSDELQKMDAAVARMPAGMDQLKQNLAGLIESEKEL